MGKKKSKEPNAQCEVCGKKFYVKPSHLKKGWGRYCSRECQHIGQRTGQYVHCEICGKKIWRTPRDFACSKSGKFFCSSSHQTIWRNKRYSGSKHPRWKEGVGTYRKKLLQSNKPDVCAKCGCGDERVLVAHHKDGNRKNNKIENLEWLCRNCHYLVHNDKNNK